MEIKKGTIVVFIIFILLIIKYSFRDFVDFFKYFGANIYPSHPTIGFLILISLILIIVFFKEIKETISRIKINGR